MNYRVFLMGLIFSICMMPQLVMAGTGDLQIGCEPGVKIYIDGKFKGVTNVDEGGLAIEGLTPGRHSLKAVMQGYEPYTKEFNIREHKGTKEDVFFKEVGEKIYQLSPESGDTTAQVGNIDLRSIPMGATISIDGQIKQGKTDMGVKDIRAGKHKIIFKRGSQNLSGIFLLEPDETLKLKADFKRKYIINISEIEKAETEKAKAEEESRAAELVRIDEESRSHSVNQYQLLPSSIQGLVAYWKLDGTAHDSSGNNHNGSIHGAVPDNDRFGNPNGAMHFKRISGGDGYSEGAGDYIEIPNDTSLHFNASIDNYSVCAWAYPLRDTDKGYETLGVIEDRSGNGGMSYQIQFYDQHVYFSVRSGTDAGVGFISAKSYNPKQWYFIALVVKNGIMYGYVNGDIVGQADVSKQFNTKTNYNIQIGRGTKTVGYTRYFDGTIADVFIYNKALTDSEVKMLYR